MLHVGLAAGRPDAGLAIQEFHIGASIDIDCTSGEGHWGDLVAITKN